MKCVNHPDRDATAQCYKCMKLLCDECRILSKDGTKAICRPCLAILKKPPVAEQPDQPDQPIRQEHMKFCKYCGGQIPEDAIVCTLCGRQVEQMPQNPTGIVINNENSNTNATAVPAPAVIGNPKRKTMALLLCIFFGVLGAHRFYEGKAATGILWALTGGLFLIGVIIDFLSLLAKPEVYYVK